MKKICQYKHSGTRNPEISGREKRSAEIARRAAAESMVLLKNEGLLPFSKGMRLALFGSGAQFTVKGGTGSGDVNPRKAVNVLEGLLNKGFEIVNLGWLKDYETRYHNARQAWRDLILGDGSEEAKANFFFTYTANPFYMPDGRPVADTDVKGADAAVYVISRNAGENTDRKLEAGDYYLTEREMEDLEILNDNKVPTVLLINAGGPVELTKAAELQFVKAILYMSQAGQEGGNAAAYVLAGDVTPSGKLTMTWARQYSDYPNAETFSYMSGDVTKEYYNEGIYVGYRYFDTFGIKPLYGFGYGLSYTDFEISNTCIENGKVTVSVRNTGDTSGKAVVQTYVSCPAGRLPKEYRRLAAFDKTPLLAPEETAELSMDISSKQLASFDEENSAWILEAGEYIVWTGFSLEESVPVAVLELDHEQIIEKTEHICPLQEALKEITAPERELPDVSSLPHIKFSPEEMPEKVICIGDNKYKEETRKEAEKLAEVLPAREMIPLLMGSISKGQGMLGAAGIRVPGSAGETCSDYMESLGLAAAVMADGPAGIRLSRSFEVDDKTEEVYDLGFLASIENGLFEEPARHEGASDYYQYCTAFPVGILLAQSFDTKLLEEVGIAAAEEMEEFHVSWWLAPGLNIQRNPLCGRNFEYYSEDPYVSGKIAAAITNGVQSLPGTGTTIKHLACNNQEDNRIGSDSIISERALREIYLRGFEIAVKESQPMCIMTSYNLINGIHAANSYDICTAAARKEWGFEGLIMTDWTTTLPECGSISHLCAKAGNDLIMPGMQLDYDDMIRAYEDGDLTDEEIRACAARIINVILQTNAYEEAVPYSSDAK